MSEWISRACTAFQTNSRSCAQTRRVYPNVPPTSTDSGGRHWPASSSWITAAITSCSLLCSVGHLSPGIMSLTATSSWTLEKKLAELTPSTLTSLLEGAADDLVSNTISGALGELF